METTLRRGPRGGARHWQGEGPFQFLSTLSLNSLSKRGKGTSCPTIYNDNDNERRSSVLSAVAPLP